MKTVKWLTQRITLLIVVPLDVVAIPWLVVGLTNLMGLWWAIDALYASKFGFWSLFIVSRLILAAIWVASAYFLNTAGERAGFFWFKPDDSYYSSKEDPRDKSRYIVGIIAICGIAICVAEMAIRLVTGLPVPYMSPSQ